MPSELLVSWVHFQGLGPAAAATIVWTCREGEPSR